MSSSRRHLEMHSDWAHGIANCNACGNEWLANLPPSFQGLECPNCSDFLSAHEFRIQTNFSSIPRLTLPPAESDFERQLRLSVNEAGEAVVDHWI